MILLVVEDEPDVRSYILHLLELQGHSVAGAGDVDQATDVMRSRPHGAFDAILLDVYLPGKPGWALVEQLRREGDVTPVIFLTAAGATQDRVRGLKLGADDYLCKPFSGPELLARLEAVVRRQRTVPTLTYGDLSLDLGRRIAERAGRRLELGKIEFDLLQALIEARGQAVSRSALFHRVWGFEFDPGTGVLDVAVARLRRKLDNDSDPILQTVTGQGYRLELAKNGNSLA
ncbi:MAG: response regulator transcription factor [bacterium]|nr:response regulator transcription factor [bacterium]